MESRVHRSSSCITTQACEPSELLDLRALRGYSQPLAIAPQLGRCAAVSLARAWIGVSGGLMSAERWEQPS
jgi:hypothetical protein